MKDDPEYATAVTHLQTRECTFEDVDLFNTHVIKSIINENRIDMSLEDNFNAMPIVPTNLLRQNMNIRKAQTNSLKHHLPLVECTVVDMCASINLSENHRQQLLRLDMSSSKLQDNLPGILTLYKGLPIVLKNKNISTDLRITNGSQGYIRELYTNFIFPTKQTYCSCAIVEFPDSVAEALSWYFSILVNKICKIMKIFG